MQWPGSSAYCMHPRGVKGGLGQSWNVRCGRSPNEIAESWAAYDRCWVCTQTFALVWANVRQDRLRTWRPRRQEQYIGRSIYWF